jgi:hypothetical protein
MCPGRADFARLEVTLSRRSSEEKAASVRVVRASRTELGAEYGTVQRVTLLLAGAESSGAKPFRMPSATCSPLRRRRWGYR